MSFPTPNVVLQSVFTGTGTDSLGNDLETWAAPIPVNVIAWQSSAVENVNGYSSRVVCDVDMAVGPGLSVSMRDRFTLPGQLGLFEVVGIEDANHGFHGWTPGSIVKLKRVTG